MKGTVQVSEWLQWLLRTRCFNKYKSDILIAKQRVTCHCTSIHTDPTSDAWSMHYIDIHKDKINMNAINGKSEPRMEEFHIVSRALVRMEQAKRTERVSHHNDILKDETSGRRERAGRSGWCEIFPQDCK